MPRVHDIRTDSVILECKCCQFRWLEERPK